MSQEKPSVINYFTKITDPRIERTKKHKLIDIIIIALCAVLAGCLGWEEIEDFGNEKEEWFKNFLALENGIPSHDTISRVLARLDPVKFQKIFFQWIDSIHEIRIGDVIAIDGKTLRHSFDKATGKSAIHMVSAFASEANLVLGQIKVDKKSNEITAIPSLLDLLMIKGAIITIDAMGFQREIADKIIKKEADYIFGLKGNQPNLQEEINSYFSIINSDNFKNKSDKNLSYYQTVDADHGRVEIREYFVSNGLNLIFSKDKWPGLASICKVISTRDINNKVSIEERYYISSIFGNAEYIGNKIRQHWAIENSLHHVLDVTLQEDASRIRVDNSAENFAVLRHIALNLIKKDPTQKKASVRRKMLLASLNDDYRLALLLGIKDNKGAKGNLQGGQPK